jgi:putative ABC transport system substrate-binding protein
MTESPSPLTMLLFRHTRRREFIALGSVAAMLLGVPEAWGQEAGRTYRLGTLALTTRAIELTRSETLPELAKQGFIEGRNLIFDARIGGTPELPGLAQALVSGRPDVLFAISTAATKAAQEATSTVPIVMFGDDPVRQGFSGSLARPSHNVTGVMIPVAELEAKRLQLLHEAVPSARRVGALFRSMLTVVREATERSMRDVAANAGLELVTFDVEHGDYPDTFANLRGASIQALAITSSPGLYRDGAQLAALALEARFPTICEWADMARMGCMIGYGPNSREMRHRAGEYIVRILQGISPSLLPVEAPRHFELAINLKTARALGVEMPQGLLLRADEVIE